MLKETVKLHVPDFDVLADAISQLLIQNVRLADLENAIEHDRLAEREIIEFRQDAAVQRKAIESKKNEFVSLLRAIFIVGRPEQATPGGRAQPRIPNLNTVSTLIDRLSIENVKLVHFEKMLKASDSDDEKRALQAKIAVQADIIGALKRELASLIEEAFRSGRYEYLKEERTFK